MARFSAIGVDLGTTNTMVAAVAGGGHTEVLRDREGHSSIPSVVLFDDDRTIVGHEARLRGRNKPQRLIGCAKLDLGRQYCRNRVDNAQIPPEVIQACILNTVRAEMICGVEGEVSVVIAVPAHFNEMQRQATAAAGEMAGLRVLDIINEPVAAVVAYGEHTPWLTGTQSTETQRHLLAFDLGAYTFEATLLDISAGTISTKATEYLSHLGGHDWDLCLAGYLAEHFASKHGVDPRDDAFGLDRVVSLAARAKLALSRRSHATVTVEFAGKQEIVRVTRDDFERVTAGLVDQLLKVCDRLLRQAGLKWEDLSQVPLVGGSTNMPMIQQAIKSRTGWTPVARVNPDEAVARGAAMHAVALLQARSTSVQEPRFRVKNVSTHSLGIVGVDPQTGRKINKILIPRGTPLPASATREFITKHASQQSITVDVLEGEGLNPNECVPLGRVVIRHLPEDMPDQWPVEVTYSYATNGRLSVDARIRYTDRTVHLETLRLNGVSEAHLQRWKQVVTMAPGFQKYREVVEWERQSMAPPIVLATTPEPPAPQEQTGHWAFLQRLVPFVFRRPNVAAVETHSNPMATRPTGTATPLAPENR